jgi:2'-5' RNA ligase
LFVGIEIDARVVERIAECLEDLQRSVARRAPHARISWVSPERLHVTVRFIGEASESEAAEIAAVLLPPLPLEPFEASFEGMGAFPPHGPPRVLWAGVAAGIDAFAAIEREVTARLRACRILPEDRRYRPHVTVARVREPAGLRTRPLLEEFERRGFGSSWVRAITLFQSRLSARGAVYVPLQSTGLGRAATTNE